MFISHRNKSYWKQKGIIDFISIASDAGSIRNRTDEFFSSSSLVMNLLLFWFD